MSARQHPVGAHALLADGRTAALIDPDGDVAWLCWPRVDSDPCLFGILDAERGGTFSVRPAGEACLSARGYQADTLVLHSEWTGPRVHLEVDDALAWGGPVRLVRVMTARDHPVDVEVRFSPSHRTGRGRPRLSVDGDVCVAGSGDARLAARAPVRWRLAAGAAVATVQVSPARPLAVTLQDATAPAAEAGPLLEATTAHWRRLAAAVDVSAVAGGSLGGRVLGAADAARLLRHSALVMLGLCQRGGGMVAAPT